MKKLAVVAFGGNALLQAGQKGTIDWLRLVIVHAHAKGKVKWR